MTAAGRDAEIRLLFRPTEKGIHAPRLELETSLETMSVRLVGIGIARPCSISPFRRAFDSRWRRTSRRYRGRPA